MMVDNTSPLSILRREAVVVVDAIHVAVDKVVALAVAGAVEVLPNSNSRAPAPPKFSAKSSKSTTMKP